MSRHELKCYTTIHATIDSVDTAALTATLAGVPGARKLPPLATIVDAGTAVHLTRRIGKEAGLHVRATFDSESLDIISLHVMAVTSYERTPLDRAIAGLQALFEERP